MLLSLVGSTVQQPVKRFGEGGVEGLALLLRLHKGVRVPHSLGRVSRPHGSLQLDPVS